MNLGPRAPKVVAKASPARALQRLWNWLMALSSRLVWAVMCLSVLNLVLFLLFSGLYISRGIQLELLDPLHQAEDRLERKIEDGELQLDCLPREGLGEELRFLRTLEQRGPDLVVVMENGRTVYYDEAADEMKEGTMTGTSGQSRPRLGLRFALDPDHGWMALTCARVDDPAGGSALVMASLPLDTLAWDLLPILGLLALSTGATLWGTRQMGRRLSRQLVQPLREMSQALAHWQGEQYDPPLALGATRELGELRDAMKQTAHQLEQARDRRKEEDEALRLFYADVSHELKTPIAVLRAQVELMRDGMMAPEELPAQADGMLAELQQLQTVVQDLVTLARIRAPGYSVERKVCSLQEILRDAGRSLVSLGSRQGVKFSLELPGDASPQDQVWTNYDRLRQLVMILGENAVKYTRPGGCAGLRLEWTARGPEVLVWDQGYGIPLRTRSRFSAPFSGAASRPAPSREKGWVWPSPGNCAPCWRWRSGWSTRARKAACSVFIRPPPAEPSDRAKRKARDHVSCFFGGPPPCSSPACHRFAAQKAKHPAGYAG